MTSLRGFDRTEFSKRVKAEAFRRCCDPQGIPHCESCNIPLRAGNIIFEHDQPDGLGGEPTLENCKVHCRNCAQTKTTEHDNPIMQRADRMLKSSYGIKARKGRPMPGTKASGIRKRMDGRVEIRR